MEFHGLIMVGFLLLNDLLVQYVPYLFVIFIVLAIVFVALAILQFIVEIIQDITYRFDDVVSNIKRLFRKN